jgi:hypothetical protein
MMDEDGTGTKKRSLIVSLIFESAAEFCGDCLVVDSYVFSPT